MKITALQKIIPGILQSTQIHGFEFTCCARSNSIVASAVLQARLHQ